MPYRISLLPVTLLLTSLCTSEVGADQTPTSELMRRAAARVEATVLAPSADRRTRLFAFSRTRLDAGLSARFTQQPAEDPAGRSFVAFTLHQDRQEAASVAGEATLPIVAWGCYYPSTDDVFVGHPKMGFVVASPDSPSFNRAPADRSRCINGD